MNKEGDFAIFMNWSSESFVSEYPDPHDLSWLDDRPWIHDR